MERVWLSSYEKGVPADISIYPYKQLADILTESFEKFSDKPCFTNFGKTLSYLQIKDFSQNFAAYLINACKLQKGDAVAIMSPNLLQYPIALFGILQAGLVVVNVNPLYTERELSYQLKDSQAKAILIFENAAHILEKILHETQIQHVFVTQIGDMLDFPKRQLLNFVIRKIKKMTPAWIIPHAKPFDQIISQGHGKFKAFSCEPDDTAFLQYTGGTTGVSKGAELSHRNILTNMVQAREWIKNHITAGEEVAITALPLYHIFSLTAHAFCYFYLGTNNILITNPKDIPAFVKEIKKWKFTAISGVNTLYNALLNHPDFKNCDFSKLTIALGGGMAVQKAVAERWKSVTKTPLIEAYGLTETSPAACINPITLQNYNGYIGLPISSTDVRIKDDQENNLDYGAVGEVCIKGPQVMKGYWKRPEETAKVFSRDGYFKTGDIGYMTKEGFVKIVDRKKDMILVSGFNVYPNEIEDVLALNPQIFESAAIGIPHETSGEVVKVFIVKKDPRLTEQQVIEFCRKNLTGYKVPKVVEFRESLPKTNVGKILRRELR